MRFRVIRFASRCGWQTQSLDLLPEPVDKKKEGNEKGKKEKIEKENGRERASEHAIVTI